MRVCVCVFVCACVCMHMLFASRALIVVQTAAYPTGFRDPPYRSHAGFEKRLA